MSDQQQPVFRLGFAELARLLGPDIVGEPVENEHYAANGDSQQLTTRGLMVWRKADNWTAFTDGYRTWVNGPNGVQERLNTERFDWERHPADISSVRYVGSPNYWPDRPYGPPIALVLHTEAGSEAGTQAWFQNPVAEVSAHFGVGLDGSIDQFVRLGDRAWANGVEETGSRWGEVYTGPAGFVRNPNNWTVSIETEDKGDPAQPVTDHQYLGVLAVARLAIGQYPSIGWLLRHADISPLSRPNCPGPRWVQSGRFAQLAADLGLRTL
jgi:hypothetical protein